MPRRILLSGATGFVGRNLLPELEAAGWEVVCGSRSPTRARRTLGDRQIRRLDVGDPTVTVEAMEGCDAAVYLVHGMREGGDYDEAERRAARNFSEGAATAGVKSIVYLGAVVPQGEPSRHLRSRLDVGRILREGSVPTVELRAAMVVGGGSESWRIVRDLAVRLPFMILPSWLETRSEPVAIDDVTAAVTRALDIELDGSTALSVPGPEVLSGKEVLERTAAQLGLEPRSIKVPLLSPRLSSVWIRLVTRADRILAEELVEGLRTDLLAEGPTIWDHMPGHERIGFDEAARRALVAEDETLPFKTRQLERVLRRIRRAPLPSPPTP